MRLRTRLLTLSAMALCVLAGCAKDEDTAGNSIPVIQSLTASNIHPARGETVTLTCTASDADGDALSYTWSADGQWIGTDAAVIQWQAPNDNVTVDLYVEVSDGVASASRTLPVVVGVDEFGLLASLCDQDFATWSAGWSRTASAVYPGLAGYFVVDLRSPGAFGLGHLSGSHNTSLAGLGDYVAANNTTNREVLLVDETGQASAFAAMGLRMLGWDAFSLTWGMAGWNDAYAAAWDAGISNDWSSAMVTAASPALPDNDWPMLNTGLTSAEAILQARVAAVFAEGYTANSLSAAQVMSSPGTFHIFNYWPQATYEDVGHINGSWQLTPGALTTATDLGALHPTQDNVLYCSTGQTSALVSCYLNALGYGAFSLRFGANALMHDDLPQDAWAPLHLNYPVVTN